MSQGLSFLRACLVASAQQEFRQALPIWFGEDEQRAYDFVTAHMSRHGRLPTLQTVAEAGIALTRADEPPAFYAERLRDRAIHAQIQHYHPGLIDGIRRNDSEAMLAAVRAMGTASNLVAPSMGMTSFADQAGIVIDHHDMARRRTGLIGVTLGWECVDLLTDGAQPGDLCILVGRPGLGKTYMMLHMMRQAWISGSSVFIASMEMPAMQIARRILGMHAGVSPQLLRNGRLSSQSYGRVVDTINGLDDMPPIHIMTGNFRKKVSDIDRAMQELSPDIGYIDAGYLMTPDKKSSSRREVISDVIEETKQVAIDRNRPLLMTVQFNRGVKKQQRGAPQLDNIAETDVIAQIASIVIGARYGAVPYERLTRILSLIKNREGDEVEWEIEFSMNPPTFGFRRLVIDQSEDDDVAPQNMNIMV